MELEKKKKKKLKDTPRIVHHEITIEVPIESIVK